MTTQRIAKVRDSLATLRQVGLPVGAVIDVGIQDGTPQLIEAFGDLHHTLFEPVAEFYPTIHKSYAGMAYTLVEAAVSDSDGSLTLKTERKTRGADAISHSYLVNGDRDGADFRKVRTVRLDTHFATQPDGRDYFLKIDVEGADVPARILRGAAGILPRCSAVMIEMTVNTFMERAAILDAAGFDVWDICDLCYYGGCLWQVDVLFVRRDLKAANPALGPMGRIPFDGSLWQSGF